MTLPRIFLSGGAPPVAFGLVAGATATLIALSVYAFILPTTNHEERTLASYEHTGDFTYNVITAENAISSSEASPAVSAEHAGILEFSYAYQIQNASQVSGSISADLEIKVDGQLGQTLSLVSPTTFRGATGVIQGSIDLTLVTALVNQIKAELGIESGSVELVLSPRVAVDAISSSQQISEIYSSPLSLEFIDGSVTAGSTLAFGEPKEIVGPVTFDNEIGLFGSPIRVSTLRNVATPLALIGLAFTCVIAAAYIRGVGHPATEEIDTRGRPRLVPTPSTRGAVSHQFAITPVIDTAALDDLEARTVIVRNFDNGARAYLVNDGRAGYLYSIGEVPEAWYTVVGAARAATDTMLTMDSIHEESQIGQIESPTLLDAENGPALEELEEAEQTPSTTRVCDGPDAASWANTENSMTKEPSHETNTDLDRAGTETPDLKASRSAIDEEDTAFLSKQESEKAAEEPAWLAQTRETQYRKGDTEAPRRELGTGSVSAFSNSTNPSWEAEIDNVVQADVLASEAEPAARSSSQPLTESEDDSESAEATLQAETTDNQPTPEGSQSDATTGPPGSPPPEGALAARLRTQRSQRFVRSWLRKRSGGPLAQHDDHQAKRQHDAEELPSSSKDVELTQEDEAGPVSGARNSGDEAEVDILEEVESTATPAMSSESDHGDDQDLIPAGLDNPADEDLSHSRIESGLLESDEAAYQGVMNDEETAAGFVAQQAVSQDDSLGTGDESAAKVDLASSEGLTAGDNNQIRPEIPPKAELQRAERPSVEQELLNQARKWLRDFLK